MTHTFVDFIPSFPCAPDDEAYLSVLPGHEMLNKGKAMKRYPNSLCSASAIVMILLLSPLLSFPA